MTTISLSHNKIHIYWWPVVESFGQFKWWPEKDGSGAVGLQTVTRFIPNSSNFSRYFPTQGTINNIQVAIQNPGHHAHGDKRRQKFTHFQIAYEAENNFQWLSIILTWKIHVNVEQFFLLISSPRFLIFSLLILLAHINEVKYVSETGADESCIYDNKI